MNRLLYPEESANYMFRRCECLKHKMYYKNLRTHSGEWRKLFDDVDWSVHRDDVRDLTRIHDKTQGTFIIMDMEDIEALQNVFKFLMMEFHELITELDGEFEDE